MRIKDLKKGYAIVLYDNYHKYFRNSFYERVMDSLDEAKYNAESLTRYDGITYAVFDCKNQKLIY